MIYVPESYDTHNDGYQTDNKAVVKLANKVLFINGIEPLCIDWNSKYNVQDEVQGKENFLHFIVCSFIKYIKYNFEIGCLV